MMEASLDLVSDARGIIVVSSVCSQCSNPCDIILWRQSYQYVTGLRARAQLAQRRFGIQYVEVMKLSLFVGFVSPYGCFFADAAVRVLRKEALTCIDCVAAISIVFGDDPP